MLYLELFDTASYACGRKTRLQYSSITLLEKECYEMEVQATQSTSGGVVTVVINCCANCVEPSCPQQWGPNLPFLG